MKRIKKSLEYVFARLHPQLTRFFDRKWYLDKNPDVKKAGIDPLWHYIAFGESERRSPGPDGSVLRVRDFLVRSGIRLSSVLLFMLANSVRDEGQRRQPLSDIPDAGADRSVFFEGEQVLFPWTGKEDRPGLIAFYLPQFHEIEENDRWWGPGFTEWTNVTRAKPRFYGHLQPRLPRDLGFYSLADPGILSRQIRLAKDAGIGAFCFYAYWFDGKRLLEKPLESFMKIVPADFRFCIVWANENWTRSWDGLESEILMSQEYRIEDDEALVRDWCRYWEHPQYLRVGSRPLFLLFRPGLIPDGRRRIERWRTLVREHSGEDPLMYMVQGFDNLDPRAFGLDGAVEFPPHKLAAGLDDALGPGSVTERDFCGKYCRYQDLILASLRVRPDNFDLIRGVVPSWDNEPRRPGRGNGFLGSTPPLYRSWLEQMLDWAQAHPVANSASLVFINAWNEWAEGAFLEPDLHYGFAYLNATARALHRVPWPWVSGKVVLFGHDAAAHGAQLLLLNLAKTLKERHGAQVEVVLLEGGPLLESYRKIGPTFVMQHPQDWFEYWRSAGPILGALTNTVGSGAFVPFLKGQGVRIVSLVHEMEGLIRSHHWETPARMLEDNSDVLVFAAPSVGQSFHQVTGGTPSGEVEYLPQGLYRKIAPASALRRKLTRRRRKEGSTQVVLGMGWGDSRKGFDLFCRAASQDSCPGRVFVWVGNLPPGMGSLVPPGLRLVPFSTEVSEFFLRADIFFLPSREDPYPSVVLEALSAGLPVVAFQGSGGVEELLADRRFGSLVPMEDLTAAAAALDWWRCHDSVLARQERSAFVRQSHGWEKYVGRVLGLLVPSLPLVSVAVLSGTRPHGIPSRPGPILRQSVPIAGFVVVDGSPRGVREFSQWGRAVQEADGDFLWIVGADEEAGPGFLAECVKNLSSATDLVFSDSAQVDKSGRALGTSSRLFLGDFAPDFDHSFTMSGRDFARRYLSVKNVIPYPSDVVFRRSSLAAAMDRLGESWFQWQFAGDWRLYFEIVSQPRSEVCYLALPENSHRRSRQRTRSGHRCAQQLREVEAMHALAGQLWPGEVDTAHQERVRTAMMKGWDPP